MHMLSRRALSLRAVGDAGRLLCRSLRAAVERREALLERFELFAGAREQRDLDVEFLAAHEIKAAERPTQQHAHVLFDVANRARAHRRRHARTDVVKNLFANHERSPLTFTPDESSKILRRAAP